MVEAAIAIPVFVVLLIGATYLRELNMARAFTRLSARSCAWEHALGGCRGDQPAHCSASVESAHDGATPNLAETTRLKVGSADNPFSDIPIVRDALAGLFGDATHAQSEMTVPFPFDDRRAGVAAAETVVVCNTVPTDVLSIAKDLLCDHIDC